ncbi:MAG: WD40 repeat domain-containing protein [Gemmataceae bacterium]
MSVSLARQQSRYRMRTVLFSVSAVLVVVAGAGAWWAYSTFWQPPHERTTLRGNEGAVRALAYAPDGKVLASGGDDRFVRLWDPVAGTLRHTLEGHESSVMALAFSTDGKTLASGSLEGTIKLWDPETGKETASKLGQKGGGVWSLAFSSDGKMLASGGKDGSVKVWNIDLDGEPKTLQAGFPIASVAFTPDSKSLAGGGGNNLNVIIWDVDTLKERGNISEGAYGSIHALAFSPNGQLLARGTSTSKVKVVNAETTKEERIFTGHTGNVFCVAFSPDSKLLASSGPDGKVKLWDLEKGTERATLPDNRSGVNAVAFSPDGKTVTSASGDFFHTGDVKLWDVPDKER